MGRETQSPSLSGTPAQGHTVVGMEQGPGSDSGRQGQGLRHGGGAGGRQAGQQGVVQGATSGDGGGGARADVGQIDAEMGVPLHRLGGPGMGYGGGGAGVEDPVSAGIIAEGDLDELFRQVSSGCGFGFSRVLLIGHCTFHSRSSSTSTPSSTFSMNHCTRRPTSVRGVHCCSRRSSWWALNSGDRRRFGACSVWRRI